MQATKSNMKRLSATWKQQKHPRKNPSKPVPLQNSSGKATDVSTTSGRRRLGQHAVCQKTSFTTQREGNASHVNSAACEDASLHPARRTSPRLKDKIPNPQDSKESPVSDSSFVGSDFEIDEEVMKHVEQLEANFQQHFNKTNKDNAYSSNISAIQVKPDGSVENVFDRGHNLQVDLRHQNFRNESVVFNEAKRLSAIHSVTKAGQNFVQSFAVCKSVKENESASVVLCKDSQSPDAHDSISPIVSLDQHSGDASSDVNDQQQDCEVIEIVQNSQGFDTQKLQRRKSSSSSPISPPPYAPDSLQMSSWGLPDAVLNQYHMMGIKEMFPWQAQCLRKGQVLHGGNLIYSAPTSAGKTLVAELLILKKVLESKKKALVILPFVSVSREKMFYLQNLLQDTTAKVDGFMGSHSPPGGLSAVDVAVCTIEKANSLVNRLLEEKNLDQLGIVVVDELHMVGDSHRGYLLELLLTKIRYVTSKDSERSSIQIVGMSATLPNLDLLAKWLDADLFRTTFRPVPLTEFVKIGPGLFNSGLQLVKNFDLKYDVGHDEDGIFSLSLETMGAGCAVLIFCPAKNWCEKLAANMARELSRLRGRIPIKSNGFVKASEFLSLEINHEALNDIIEQLRRTPAGLDSTLKRTLPCAVAYHHAGLTFDERDIIEGGFRQGHIRILVATSTLSSGVNLPARRVIIRTIMFHRKVIDPLCYQQMAGRAGRKGVDTEGESILVCKQNEMDKAKKLLSSDLPPVKSCLIQRDGEELSNSMKRAILEVIASGVASTPDDVQRYSSCTLLVASLPADDSECKPDGNNATNAIDACISFLKEHEFIRLQQDDSGGVFLPSQLGSATLASALSPHEALAVFTELQRARKSFVLENELHILYLVTPIYDSIQPDWYQFLRFWESLSSDKRRVGELVGVEERFLIRAAKGNIPSHTAKQQHLLGVHRRFHTAMILEELVNETPLTQVARKYSCTKGQLQSLQQSASTFSGMVTIFCSKLGWFNLELLLAQFQSRLNFGVQRELVDLVRISLLNAQHARLLYNSGFTSVAALANATSREVEGILRNAIPFKSGRKAVDENQFEAAERRAARCIWVSGKKGLTEAEAADVIITEARQLVQAELGSVGIEWCPKVLPKKSNVSVKGVDSKKGGQSLLHKEKEKVQKCEVTIAGIKSADQSEKGLSEVGHAVMRSGQELKSSNLKLSDLSKMKEKKSLQSESKIMEVVNEDSSSLPRKNSGLKKKGVSNSKGKSSEVRNRSRLVDQSVRGFIGSSIVQTANSQGKNIKAEKKVEEMHSSSLLRGSGSLLQEEVRVTEKKKVGTAEEDDVMAPVTRRQVGERLGGIKHTVQNESEMVEDQTKTQFLGHLNREGCQMLVQPSKSMVTSSTSEARKNVLPNTVQCMKRSVNSRRVTPRCNTELEKEKEECDRFSADPDDKSLPKLTSNVRNVERESNPSFSDEGGRVKALQPVFRDSKTSEKEKSPELFLDSPDKKQETEPEEDKVQQYVSENISLKKETRTHSSPQEEYSLLFSPIDSCLQEFLDNYDSQQELIAVSASPELLNKEKKNDERRESSKGCRDSTSNSKEPVVNEKKSSVNSRGKTDMCIQEKLSRGSESAVHQDCRETRNGDSAGSNASVRGRRKSNLCQGVGNRQVSKKLIQDGFRSKILNDDVKANISPKFLKQGKGLYVKCDTEPCSDASEGCNEECLSPGTLAVLDMMADGDLDEITFTAIKSPLQSESPDLFSEEIDVNLSLSDKVKGHAGSIKNSERRDCEEGSLASKLVPARHVGQSKDENTTSDKVSAVGKVNGLSKLNGNTGRGWDDCLKNKSVDLTSPTAGSWKEKRRKRKSNEKTPADSCEGFKRTRGTEKQKTGTRSKKEEQMDLSSITACNESFKRTPLKGKTPLSFLNVRNSRLSGGKSNRQLRSSSCKRKAQLSFRCETPSDVDIENVSSEGDDLNQGDDLDIAMDSEELDLELGSPLTETPQLGAKCKQNEIYDKGLEKKQSELRDGSLRDQVPLSNQSQTADVRVSESSSEVSVCESSSIASSTPNTFSIIDVCANRDLFTMFLSEWRRKRQYAFSVACEHFEVPVEGGGIGAKYRKGRCSPQAEVDGLPLEQNSLLITGLAVSWGAKDAYFISFQRKNSPVDLDQSLSAPPLEQSISVDERIQEVNSILEMTSLSKGSRVSSICKAGFDVKEQVKVLAQVLGCVLPGPLEDPKVAHWLLDPSAKEKNLHGMVAHYTQDQVGLLENVGGGIGLSSLGISPQNPGSGRLRACVESVLIMDLMEALKQRLKENDLYDAFREIEMPSIITLIHVELNGIGFSTEECETQKIFMQSKLTVLEEQAYLLAGRSFSLTSPEDIAQVLYLELKLPPNGEVRNSNQGRVAMPTRKTLGGRGRGQMPKHFSTSKEALEKIKSLHPLPGLILEWRKLSMSLTKVVFPLQKDKVYNKKLGMDRLFPVYQTHTATGRVATVDPNIQSIPKDFEISLPSVIGESPPHWTELQEGTSRPKKNGKATRSSNQCKMKAGENKHEDLKTSVSLRHAFLPFRDGVFLAADYSQLELRILAHLSQDGKLIRILNSDGDVFRQIAAQWKNLEEKAVTDQQRQEAKQICYGMIYGIGARALSEQLGISEEDAACFMETFRDQYKGIKTFIKQVVEKCQKSGYVQTITGRKRYLPSIHHSNVAARNHAERQAVNTTIQGSAADLVKTAMVKLQQKLATIFPPTNVSHRHKDKSLFACHTKRQTRRSQMSPLGHRGAYLVLQLHDELIYEVHNDDVDTVIQLVKKEMESAMTLLVKLPVKIKVGPTWGSLSEII